MATENGANDIKVELVSSKAAGPSTSNERFPEPLSPRKPICSLFSKACVSVCIRGLKAGFKLITCHSFSKKQQAAKVFKPETSEVSRAAASTLFESGNRIMQDYMEKIACESGNRAVQVGGHDGSFKLSGPVVSKKLLNPAELDFYNTLKGAEAAGDAARAWPLPFCARFLGEATEDSTGDKYILMENLVFPYKSPCVMDLKIGTRTAEDTAGIYKQMRMHILDELSGAAVSGVQLIAMSVCRPRDNVHYKMKKSMGYRLTVSTPLEHILGFFLSDGERIDPVLVESYKQKIEALLAAFEKQRSFQFIGSSLLFIHEGNPSPKSPLSCDVKMIDFAHVLENEEAAAGGDPSYIVGLRSILSALEALQSAQHLSKTGMQHVMVANRIHAWRAKAKRHAQGHRQAAAAVRMTSDELSAVAEMQQDSAALLGKAINVA
mmetsp:Transcript_10052/g.23971  ORF Transcript_10052/g.23971 Transcript_10052/m.23971 type:complete len:435 (+) Transcript_10052:185-1489(+)